MNLFGSTHSCWRDKAISARLESSTGGVADRRQWSLSRLLSLTLGLLMVAVWVTSMSPLHADQELRPVDDRLEQLVEAALSADPIVESFDIVVTAIDGTVRLNGAVDSKDERAQAGSVAGDVEGVVEVDNRITVAHTLVTPGKTDRILQREILNDVAKAYPGESIEVRVENGFATFTGAVSSTEARRGLTEIAFRAGALLVKNEVRVQHEK